VLWHEGTQHVFRNLRDKQDSDQAFGWRFHCSADDGLELEATIDGSGPGIHVLPYLKTDCSGTFDVTNNSLAKAHVCLQERGGAVVILETDSNAVLEKTGGAIRTRELSPGGLLRSRTLTR
jgi:hypothetical protein